MLFHPRERGQGLVEYALIILLVALVLILIVTLLGTQISQLYSKIVTSWP
jgi:pilus assembly protein Flp/PilA